MVKIWTVDEIRQAFADYVVSEGCTCCQDMRAHTAATARLAVLLNVEPYPDGSGFQFRKYASGKKTDDDDNT